MNSWVAGSKIVVAVADKPRQMLIGGKWVDAASGKTFQVNNPADGSVIAEVAAGDRADVDLAVGAARQAFERGSWRAMTPAARAKLIWKLADLIDAHAEELALIETLDNGKPLRFSKMLDIPSSSEKLRYYAGWATKLNGETMSLSGWGEFQAFTVREPVGVVGLIVPWNFPLMMAVSKLAPALAAGCTTVLKPAEQTPLSALRLGELVLEAGFPEGVVNIVTGFGETAGAAISEHMDIDKVSFTGSTEIGKIIIGAARGNLKRVTLELGGKSPMIVFPDADLDRAVPDIANGIFFNSGQGCYVNSRLYAHEKVYQELVERVAAYARGMKVGNGIDENTVLGPLISRQQLERVSSYVSSARADGATVVTGGESINGPGYFLEPTVLAGTTVDMTAWREEIFGPVLCTTSYEEDDLDKIAAEANNSAYGLAAYVYTRDISTALKMARKLKAGTVRINSGAAALDDALPFGGYKQSGWGRENGREGIDVYTELKSVSVAL